GGRVVLRRVPEVGRRGEQSGLGRLFLDHRVGGDAGDVGPKIGGAPHGGTHQQPAGRVVVDRVVVPDQDVVPEHLLRRLRLRVGDGRDDDAVTGPLHDDGGGEVRGDDLLV